MCPRFTVGLLVTALTAWRIAAAQTGACCNPVQGICQYVTSCEQCGPEYGCYPGITCAELSPPCTATAGACCYHREGVCYEWYSVQAVYCDPPDRERFIGASCWEIECSSPAIWYVDQHATGPIHDGMSWCTAFAQLQDAIDAAGTLDIIRVADGVYRPDPTGLADPRDATFWLKTDVTVEGGYAGCGAADPDERGIAGFPSILSGDLSGDDGPNFTNIDENCYHVVTAQSVTNTILDGAAVVSGSAVDGRPGGGLLCESSQAKFAGCRFIANYSNFLGAGAVVSFSSVDFADCLFDGNSAPAIGGLLAAGGVANLINCTFASNVSRSRDYGGGLGVSGPDTATTMTNCVFWANLARQAGETAQIYTEHAPTVEINYTSVEGWTGAFGGAGNIGLDPLFMDVDGADDVSGTVDDDLRLSPGSPCINAGDPSLPFDPADVDFDGHPRVLCGRIDMGAYESGIGDSNCDSQVNLSDFSALQACFTGAGGPFAAGCEGLDFEADGDVDLRDFAAFFELLNLPGSP